MRLHIKGFNHVIVILIMLNFNCLQHCGTLSYPFLIDTAYCTIFATKIKIGNQPYIPYKEVTDT